MGKTQQSKRFRRQRGSSLFTLIIDADELKVRRPFAPKSKAFVSVKDKERKPKYKRDFLDEV